MSRGGPWHHAYPFVRPTSRVAPELVEHTAGPHQKHRQRGSVCGTRLGGTRGASGTQAPMRQKPFPHRERHARRGSLLASPSAPAKPSGETPAARQTRPPPPRACRVTQPHRLVCPTRRVAKCRGAALFAMGWMRCEERRGRVGGPPCPDRACQTPNPHLPTRPALHSPRLPAPLGAASAPGREACRAPCRPDRAPPQCLRSPSSRCQSLALAPPAQSFCIDGASHNLRKGLYLSEEATGPLTQALWIVDSMKSRPALHVFSVIFWHRFLAFRIEGQANHINQRL